MASFIWASYLTHFFWPFFSQEITVKMEDLYIVNSLAFSVSCGATCLCCKLKAQQQRLHVPDFLWMAPTGNVQPEVSRGGEMSVWGFLWLFLKSGVSLESTCVFIIGNQIPLIVILWLKKVWACVLFVFIVKVSMFVLILPIYPLYTIPGQAQTLTVHRKVT